MTPAVLDKYGYCPSHGIPVTEGRVCRDCLQDKPVIDSHRRLNVGCGQWPLLYWRNLDASPEAIADQYVRVPPLPYDDASLDDIYAGHFVEHLDQVEAHAFVAECYRCLVPGGRLGVVVPDTREILTRWLRGDRDCVEFPRGVYRAVADLDEICALFLYSTAQDSPHQWSYDRGTLTRLLESEGFTVTGEIDRYRDPRISVGTWYSAGLDCVKPR